MANEATAFKPYVAFMQIVCLRRLVVSSLLFFLPARTGAPARPARSRPGLVGCPGPGFAVLDLDQPDQVLDLAQDLVQDIFWVKTMELVLK